MKTVFLVGTTLTLVATVLGFIAPEPSTAAIYRALLLSYAFLTLVSRMVSLSALNLTDKATFMLASKIRPGAISHPAPEFVKDHGFGVGAAY